MNQEPLQKKLRPIMLAGTGSDVGKSVLATALCRIFKQDGYHPAPFKAQNMALNSFATPEGLEIGRAQAVQAEAAGIPCHTDMNPLLLKPSSDHTSQVILHGQPIGNTHAYDYFRKEGREELRSEVNRAFDRLEKRYNPIVMEGAGSISELNLKDSDLVNMPMARHADAAVILVADIDRGGVFASIYGSIMLQTPEDRQRIKGIIINKFRGDLSLFAEGSRLIEELTGVSVLGVVPYFQNITIEEEDSVSLAQKNREAMQGKVNVAVVLMGHLSNFTDFGTLESDPRVHLYYTNNITELSKADIIILPGSKNTLGDLAELRNNGVAQAIIRAHRAGTTIIGICGGYQMMGQMIHDPQNIEGSGIKHLPGHSLLPTETTLEETKITRQVAFTFRNNPTPCQGYEIHMGRTQLLPNAEAEWVNRYAEASSEGTWLSDRCWGSYIHGILDNATVIEAILAPFVHEKAQQEIIDYPSYKERQYDLLADHVRKHVDMEQIYQIIKL